MSQRTLSVEHIQRHDTSSNWTTKNPILKQAMIGIEDDTGKFKIGDGVKSWNDLQYSGETTSFIKDSNSKKNYDIWIGTQEEYSSLENKNEFTIYIVR